MRVVNLAQYRNRELVAVCRDLLELAEGGHAQGLAFIVKMGRTHRVGVTGDYDRKPDEALAAAVRLKERLLQEEPEEESGTGPRG